MRPTRWRRSTHVVVGVAVLLLVAAVVAAAAVLTAGRHPTSDAAGRQARTAARRPPSPASCPSPTRRPNRRPTGSPPTLAPAARRSEPGQPDRPDHRRDDRRAAVGAGRRRADAAGVDQQGAHRGRGAADPRPRRPLTTRVLAAGTQPGAGGAEGRRGSDAVGGAARPGHLVPGRGADQRPGRPGAAQRHRGRPPCRSTSAPTAGRRWRRAGIPLDIDGGDIAPMESVMLDGGRTQPVSVESRRSDDPGAGRRPRAGRRAGRRPGHRHGAAIGRSAAARRSRRCSRRR